MYRFSILCSFFFLLIASQDISDKFPYLLSVATKKIFDGDIITLSCGAVMLNSNWALTTAMCAGNIKTDLLYISTNNTYFIPVAEVVVNPNYNFVNTDSDISLIKTTTSIEQFCEKCTPVQLPIAPSNPGDRVTLTGWGYTNISLVDYEILTADVTVIGPQDCNTTFLEINFPPVGDNLFCTQNYFNDSSTVIWMLWGGSVMQNNKLLGLMASDTGFYYPNLPAICTDVFKFVDWIQETINS